MPRLSPLFGFLIAVPLAAALEPISVDVGGETQTFFTVERAEPFFGQTFVSAEQAIFLIAETVNGIEAIYNDNEGLGLPGSDFGLTSSNTRANIATSPTGAYVTMWDRANNFTPPSDGLLLRYSNGTFSEIGAPASEALGEGNSGFHYRFPVVSPNDAVAMIGFDQNFPHFVLRVANGAVEILAQESTTPFPGTSQFFTEFEEELLAISADGSRVIFAGRTEGAQNLTGIFVTDGSTIETVLTSATLVPGTDEPFGDIMGEIQRNRLKAGFGPGGEVFVFSQERFFIAEYSNGSLSMLIQQGDNVAGAAVGEIRPAPSRDLAPNGFILVNDFQNSRYLLFNGMAFSEFLDRDQAQFQETFGNVELTAEGAYIVERTFIEATSENDSTLVFKAFDAAAGTRLHDFTQTGFTTIQAISGDTFVFNVSGIGLFRGSTADFTVDGGGGGTEPVSLGEYLSELPAGLRDPRQDADDDGILNIAEYVLGLVADRPDSLAGRIETRLERGEDLGLTGDSNQYLVVAVRQRPGLSGADVVPLGARRLCELGASGSAFVPVGTPVMEAGDEIVTYRSTFTIDDGSGFAQLRYSVAVPPP